MKLAETEKNKTRSINQKKHIEAMLKRFDPDSRKIVATPMLPDIENVVLKDNTNPVDPSISSYRITFVHTKGH